ncbi:MAG: hypothetical protein B6D57_04965 [Candidatus Coatesbacteria bacterium 4484_99]|uniref:Polyprenyl synthetase n=1 Tax=Candidatus Coatesbacteria bacterium 4484_99 TaxID=1970774 RepID=A0A1W9RZR7_9BACT|nr:MAG: hypothetical protein B6D57_04965 [Candidatus Coatesbacteria bacterium 4484_99]
MVEMHRRGKERFSELFEAIDERSALIERMIFDRGFHRRFSPNHLNIAVYSYFKQGGKALRPAVLLFACGAVGGDEEMALPAAAALEAYHTWTLVHDDIIDQDNRRRGGPTVHALFKEVGEKELNFDPDEAKHYGISMGILAGDIQHAWAVSLLCKMAKSGVNEGLVLELIDKLESDVLPSLLEGETLDIQLSSVPLSTLTEASILRMLWKKTGVLYRFAGWAGAIIGGGTIEEVAGISSFCSRCGLAFQLVDDILGLVGDEDVLGKPVGSDIREGKKTIPILFTYKNSGKEDRDFIEMVLGNNRVDEGKVKQLVEMVRVSGGIDYTDSLARRLVSGAREKLNVLRYSRYKKYFELLSEFIVSRDY